MPTRVRSSDAPLLVRRSVYVSASVPSELLDLRFDVEEAILSLARAVFTAGGRLVVVADGFLALLAAAVGAEYVEPPVLEAEHQDHRPSPTAILLHTPPDETLLDELALVQDAGAAELYTALPDGDGLMSWTPGALPPVTATWTLRRELFEATGSIAMVAIGQPSDLRGDAALAAMASVPLYLAATTMPPGAPSALPGEVISLVDRYVTAELLDAARPSGSEAVGPADVPPGTDTSDDVVGTPYPFIMQRLVRDLSHAGPGG